MWAQFWYIIPIQADNTHEPVLTLPIHFAPARVLRFVFYALRRKLPRIILNIFDTFFVQVRNKIRLGTLRGNKRLPPGKVRKNRIRFQKVCQRLKLPAVWIASNLYENVQCPQRPNQHGIDDDILPRPSDGRGWRSRVRANAG